MTRRLLLLAIGISTAVFIGCDAQDSDAELPAAAAVQDFASVDEVLLELHRHQQVFRAHNNRWADNWIELAAITDYSSTSEDGSPTLDGYEFILNADRHPYYYIRAKPVEDPKNWRQVTHTGSVIENFLFDEPTTEEFPPTPSIVDDPWVD